MKTKLLLTLALMLSISHTYWAQTAGLDPQPEYPYVEVVVTQEQIWLMPGEKPISDIPVQIVNEAGEVVLQKICCSKRHDWSIDLDDLPSGKYKILIGNTQTEYLEKKGRRWTM